MSEMPNKEQLGFGLVGICIGVVLTTLVFVVVSFPRSPDFDLSNLVVRAYAHPESEQTLVVFGCLPMHNGRSGGQNAPLAAQRRIDARIEAGIFIDRNALDYQTPLFTETLASVSGTRAVRNRIRSEIRREYGCDFAYSFPTE